MITLYAQLAGIVLALACVNALVRRAYRRRKPELSFTPVIVWGYAESRMAETTCVADLGSARAIVANGGER